MPPEPSYLVGRYGEIENEIDNLDNQIARNQMAVLGFYGRGEGDVWLEGWTYTLTGLPLAPRGCGPILLASSEAQDMSFRWGTWALRRAEFSAPKGNANDLGCVTSRSFTCC